MKRSGDIAMIKVVVPVNMDDINKLLPYVLFNPLHKISFCDFCVYLQGGLTGLGLIF